uniref:RxLR effector protein n=1 Tax=Phytophthora sojae TaxID=67593 RepID=G1FRZ9_PHYSO|nr:Avh196 [Phytophthora sojae]
MRALLVLLLAVATLLAGVSGSVSNLQTSQNLIQPADAVESESTQGRMLLRTAGADEEERGILDVVKKLGTSTAKWPKNTYHKLYVNFMSGMMDIEKTANAFLKKNINPDKVFKWLKLSNGDYTHERKLYDLYKEKYIAKHPGWTSKLS